MSATQDKPKPKSICDICKRSKAMTPSLKLYIDKPRPDRQQPGTVCGGCRLALDAWPEKALIFQALSYLMGART